MNREDQPKPQDSPVDHVEEASEESFPASDAPSRAVGTEEKGGEIKHNPPDTQGCAISFLLEERGEIGGICGEVQPDDPKEEYVQPEKEKEAGGEG